MKTPPPARTILLVEDNPGDIRLTQKAFEKARLDNHLHAVRSGHEALDFLRRRGEHADAPSVDLVLLDLNLTDCRGTDILEQIKNSPTLKRIPVVILTSSEADVDIAQAYDRHANAYITKPVDFPGLLQVVRDLNNFWFNLVTPPPLTHANQDT